jgi:carboxyl-terminal processing protease
MLLCFTLFASSLIAQDITSREVNEIFGEMLRLHVQHRTLSPLLIKRSYKLFLEQFDSSKIYLLESEVSKYIDMSEGRLQKGIERLNRGDLSDFIELRKLVQKGALRARTFRDEMEKELILSAHDIVSPKGESYLTFPKNERELKTRIHNLLVRALIQEQSAVERADWTPQTRAKIFALFERRFQRIEASYLESGEREDHYLASQSLRALAKCLDAHSAYFTPEEATEMRTSLEKQFEGVGVILKEGVSGIQVVNLVKGGPAERSGRIQPGDLLVEIAGQPLEGLSYQQVLEAMKGDGKKDLQLGVKRSGSSEIIRLKLPREKIAMQADRLRIEAEPVGSGIIGRVTLPSFYEGGNMTSAERDFREALKKLKKQGEIKGLVLDMRENSGGFLSQAVKVAGLFIARGVIVISKYGLGEVRYLRNLDGRLFFDGPMVVLTSKASASAAEIVAQALQDYGAALVVGDERTYGKGTIQYQTVTDPSARAFYKVTVGRYYTASGRSTQIDGVIADITVPSEFSAYNIGERYLEYPLENDRVAAAFVDPLTDIDGNSRNWFHRNYLPNLQKPQARFQKMVPQLAENSKIRLAKDPNFTLFLQNQEKLQGRTPQRLRRPANHEWGAEDLQMTEAVNILKDMIYLNQ